MKMKKEEINENAITLISLVVTIIILLILTGVVLNLTIGKNDVIYEAEYAREETNKQTATEKINLKITTAQMNKYAEEQRMPTLKELSLSLKDDAEIEYVTEVSKVASTIYEVGDNPKSIYTKLNNYPYEFEINSSLQLASINGVKVGFLDGNTSSSNIYSNSEQVVGTWINGKPLYRKVIVYENLTYDGNIFTGSLGLQNVESYCRCEVYHTYDNLGFQSYRTTNSSYFIDWFITGDNIYITNKASNIKNYNYVVIVEYTKTKD